MSVNLLFTFLIYTNVFNRLIIMDEDGPAVARLVQPSRNRLAIEEEPLGFDLTHHRSIGKDSHAAQVGIERVTRPGVDQVVITVTIFNQEPFVDPRRHCRAGRLTNNLHVFTTVELGILHPNHPLTITTAR